MKLLLTLLLSFALSGQALARVCPCLMSGQVPGTSGEQHSDHTPSAHPDDCPTSAARKIVDDATTASSALDDDSAATSDSLCLHCSACMNVSAPPMPTLLLPGIVAHSEVAILRLATPPTGVSAIPLRPPIV